MTTTTFTTAAVVTMTTDRTTTTNNPLGIIGAKSREEMLELVKDDVRTVLLVTSTMILSLLCVVGVVTNILNIVVFIKQGFREQTIITLFGLALSDLGNMICLLFMSVYSNPWFLQTTRTFDPLKVGVAAGLTRIGFTRITSWITAFVAIERCLCVAAPLKVKLILTPRRRIFVLCAICVTMTSSVIPIFYINFGGPRIPPTQNETAVQMASVDGGKEIQQFAYIIQISSFLSTFITIAVCTPVLICKLITTSKWRRQVARGTSGGNGTPSSMSLRDLKIVKIVATISVTFIVCYVFGVVNIVSVIQMDEPRAKVPKDYETAEETLAPFIQFFLEATNAIMNLFVYVSMSSKFRQTFIETFSCSGNLSQERA